MRSSLDRDPDEPREATSGSRHGASRAAAVLVDGGGGAAGGSDPRVIAAMAGDAEAIRAVWEEHRRWVAAVLLAHKPSFEDLDDLLQEVAMTLVGKIDTLREATNIRAWLRTVAVNAARAAGRSGRHRPRPELPPENELTLTGRSVATDRADDEHVRRLLARVEQLPETYREPLLLRAVQGMSSKQIADVLGVQPATVDTRIARARRMLRGIERETDDGTTDRDAGPRGSAAARRRVAGRPSTPRAGVGSQPTGRDDT